MQSTGVQTLCIGSTGVKKKTRGPPVIYLSRPRTLSLSLFSLHAAARLEPPRRHRRSVPPRPRSPTLTPSLPCTPPAEPPTPRIHRSASCAAHLRRPRAPLYRLRLLSASTPPSLLLHATTTSEPQLPHIVPPTQPRLHAAASRSARSLSARQVFDVLPIRDGT